MIKPMGKTTKEKQDFVEQIEYLLEPQTYVQKDKLRVLAYLDNHISM